MDSDEQITFMTSSLSFPSTCTSSPLPQSSSLGHPHPSRDDESSPPPFVVRTCGACKGLCRQCVGTCILAPCFPPTQPLKFLSVHRVFGVSNVSNFLQGILESRRADAADSMVYEAKTRIKDPVHGCAGVISCLQKLINHLQIELATVKAQLLNITSQQENLQSTLQQPSLEDFMFCRSTPTFQNWKNFSWDNSFFPFDRTYN